MKCKIFLVAKKSDMLLANLMKLLLFICVSILTTVAIFTPRANAYPEMVRHGYSSCLACHVSPSGGGVLSEYGRELSRELLSTWGAEQESQPMYGILKFPEFATIGGDARWLQVTQSNPIQERGLFFNMQLDLEAALFWGNLSGVASIGRKVRVGGDSSVFSHRHFISYLYDDKIGLRFGRFYPEYGINTPNHRRFVRQFFGFNQYEETYNLEATYNTETFNVFATGIFGRFDIDPSTTDPILAQERQDSGFALTFNYFLFEKHRLGASIKYGSLDDETRSQAALYGLLGFSKKFYVITEINYRKQDANDPARSKDSWGDLVQVNFEVFKGFHIYVLQQFYAGNTSSSAEDQSAFGAGATFFPRPHWELNVEYQTRMVQPFPTYEDDVFYLLLHFYL